MLQTCCHLAEFVPEQNPAKALTKALTNPRFQH